MIRIIALSVLLFFSPFILSEESALTFEEEQYLLTIKAIWDSFDRQQGEIELPNGVATLQVSDQFYYLNPKDTETVLADIWGNPPETSQNTLGMLFPVKVTPFDYDAWGVTIEYEEDGYVSDSDADKIDYDTLLSQMQKETQQASQQRVKLGYESIELIGWASAPYYDKQSHKLHWAKEIKFGDQEVNTLNYDIRILGRKGVLVLSFIANIDQKEAIKEKVPDVLALANFNEGFRYQDFNPDIDKIAAYGIGGLIAGHVLVKTGILAAALIFLKKFGVFIVVGIGALVARLFNRKST